MLLEMGTPIATATLRLDNDQILNNRDPIVLVPPTDVTDYLRAPRTLPVPESFKYVFNDTNGEYSDVVTLKLIMGDSDVVFFTNTLSPQGLMSFNLNTQTDMNAFPYNQDLSTLLKDNGLYIKLSSGALTGGDSANFFYVSLQFSGINL